MFKTMRFILGIFTLIGLAMMLLGGYLAYKNSEIEKNGVITTGRIVDLEESRAENSRTYCPVVEYTVDNDVYTLTSSFCSSGYANSVDDTVDVIYLPTNPNDATIYSFDAFYGSAIAIFVMGFIPALIGFLVRLFMSRKNKLGQRLLREGVPVEAKISQVILNTQLKINGRSPHRVIAQRYDTAKNSMVHYYSENLDFDPEPYIQQETVTVYLDKKKPKKYYMDIHSILEME